MAIKIIKQGTKEFHVTCPFCGCEFTYEKEDIHDSKVTCPCCSTNLLHKNAIETIPSPLPIWYNQQVVPDGYKIRGDLNKGHHELHDGAMLLNNESSCVGCPNNPKYFKTPYVGDTPCQWYQKNPQKVTC